MYPHITLVPNQTSSLFFLVSQLRLLKLRPVNHRTLFRHSILDSRKSITGSPRNRLPASGKPAPALAMVRTMVLFDFDRTIIDGDSDNWVVTEMGQRELFSELRYKMPWNSLMDRILQEIHSQGKTVQDIATCLCRAPIHPSIVSAIKSAHSLGCELRIISDANQFFIKTILEHHGILRCFSGIKTNPTYIDSDGRLRILPCNNLSWPHGCNLCPPNMCKGMVIDNLRRNLGSRRIIYLGDGGGDFCPTLRLVNGDHVMPRKDFPLWTRIMQNKANIKAEIHEWINGDELQTTLLHLIDPTSTPGPAVNGN